jgi:sigma-B regulation protein RsbU (phosphoserine phosphatase)
MAAETTHRILVHVGGDTDAEDLCNVLADAGYRVARSGYNAHHLLLVDEISALVELQSPPARLYPQWADSFVPILFVTADPDSRLDALAHGANACLVRPFSAAELLAQVHALLRLKEVHDRLGEKNVEFHRANKRLFHAYRQTDEELEFARRIQQTMLPKSFPAMPAVQFAVYYHPCGRVGGDFYDAFRLDENHVGFYVADVMGHGLPAALLTIFLKNAVQAREVIGNEYRLLPPSEVLKRLNREMIQLALAESPFLTMIYALYDGRDSTIAFARAGHPHPLYLPHSGQPEFLTLHGTLLGVFDTQFAVQKRRLNPGDKLLIYTDGIETGKESENGQGVQRLLAAVDKCRSLPIADLVAQISRELFAHGGQADDLTLLGIEISDGLASQAP